MQRIIFTSLLGTFFWLYSSFVQAVMIGDVDVPDVIPRTSDTPELFLNGASMRILYGVVDTYVGQLYLEEKSTDAQIILNSDGVRRMVFQSVLKRVSGRRMATALYEAININTTKAEAESIRNINAMYYPLCQLYLRPVARVSNGYFSGISEVVVIKIDAI